MVWELRRTRNGKFKHQDKLLWPRTGDGFVGTPKTFTKSFNVVQ